VQLGTPVILTVCRALVTRSAAKMTPVLLRVVVNLAILVLTVTGVLTVISDFQTVLSAAVARVVPVLTATPSVDNVCVDRATQDLNAMSVTMVTSLTRTQQIVKLN